MRSDEADARREIGASAGVPRESCWREHCALARPCAADAKFSKVGDKLVKLGGWACVMKTGREERGATVLLCLR